MMASIFLMLAITACHDNEDKTDYAVEADHTVLMYLNGDSNLSSAIISNLNDASSALADSMLTGKINLVVFKDTYASYGSRVTDLPRLVWIHPNGKSHFDQSKSKTINELDTVPLLTFTEEVNASSPAVFQQVLSATFKRFDTKIKGLLYGSHALGWVPAPSYKASSAPDRGSISANYIGIDEDNPEKIRGSMELYELRQSLEAINLKLDYLLFDACNMGGIETAYELRDRVHYMVAAPTEIEGNGFPYKNVITRLSQCSSINDLPAALDYCAQCYYRKYCNQYGATISLFDLTQVNQLASLTSSILATPEAKAVIDQMEARTDAYTVYDWQSQFQAYGRNQVKSSFYFYDAEQYLSYLSPASAAEVKASVAKVVLSHYFTERYESIDIEQCCGLSMAIRPCFNLYYLSNFRYANLFSTSSPNLRSVYNQLQWGININP